MPASTIKAVFSATLGSMAFESQSVALGGVYPEIEIENLGTPEGLHHFKIAKALPYATDDMIASAVEEASTQIEVFWNVLAYIRGSSVHPSGDVQYEIEGRLIRYSREESKIGRPTLTGIVGAKWFEVNQAAFHQSYDYDLLKRLNFARALSDPVSRFLSLYALLSSLASDTQREIDKLIELEEPTIGKSISPKSGKPESLFTRLRNELAHHREGGSIFSTHDEIRLHVGRFDWVVGRILAKHVKK